MAHKFNTREEWLGFITDELRPAFRDVQAPIPAAVRHAIGFMATGYRSKHIGECHDKVMSGDKHVEIFIAPQKSDPIEVAGILAHELVHAAVGNKEGHKGRFRTVAKALGFTGKMTSCLPPLSLIESAVKAAGPLPHSKLTVYARKKQTTRLLKCECLECGYVARVTAKWVDTMGAPYCGNPKHGRMLCEDEAEEMEE